MWLLKYGVLIFVFFESAWAAKVYKVCAYSSYDMSKCKALESGQSRISCLPVKDSVDCALKMYDSDGADFGVFGPDELIIALKHFGKYFKRVGEFRHRSRLYDTFSSQMVAIVRKGHEGGFRGLLDKSYCHPGFENSNLHNYRVLKFFENKVVPTQCDPRYSLAELEVQLLSNHFGKSCRPLPWSRDPYLDKRLAQTYSELCALCDSKCSYHTHEDGSMAGTLNCLLNKGGYVGYLTLSKVQEYINKPNNTAFSDGFQFLCVDQTLQDLNDSNPCTWVNQPWHTLISKGSMDQEFINLINDVTSGQLKEPWAHAFNSLITPHDHKYSYIPSSTDSLISEINRGGVDENHNTQIDTCDRPVRWCLTSQDEQNKCRWLSEIADTFGIRPAIKCDYEAGSDMWSCLDRISRDTSDIISIDVEYGFLARRAYNLSAIVYEDTNHQSNYQVIAVLKSSDSQIKSFKNLRNVKACFPEYGTLGWVAAVKIANERNILGKSCPEKLFSSACAPGIYEKTHQWQNLDKGYLEQLCTLCPASSNSGICPTNETNTFFGDLGALRCLASNGQIAFVDYKRLLTEGNVLDSSVKADDYKVLCKNDTIVPGLSVDENCAISVGIRSEVVGRASRSDVENANMVELLLQLDHWFGTYGEDSETVLHMYEDFSGKKGLLFKDTTVSLLAASEINYDKVNSYKDLLSKGNYTCKGSASSMPMFQMATIVLISLLGQLLRL